MSFISPLRAYYCRKKKKITALLTLHSVAGVLVIVIFEHYRDVYTIQDVGLERRVHILPFHMRVPAKTPYGLAKKSNLLINILFVSYIYIIYIHIHSLCR